MNGAGRSLGAANPATSISINAFGGAAAIALRADDARGLLRQSEQQYLPAIDDFTAAHGLMPQQVDQLLARALSYRAVGQANLDEAVQDDPQNAQLWMNGGLAYERLGDKNKAAASYARAINLRPQDEAARTGFACVGGN